MTINQRSVTYSVLVTSLSVTLLYLCFGNTYVIHVNPLASQDQYSTINDNVHFTTDLKPSTTSTANNTLSDGQLYVNVNDRVQLPSDKCDLEPDHWSPRRLPAHLSDLDHDDARLVAHIRDCWILPPTGRTRKLTDPYRTDYSQRGQGVFLDAYFLKTRNITSGGFYVECGAFDGERLSNTLALEIQRNWTGLLIEADPRRFQEIVAKYRNAYTLNACLSTSPKPAEMNYSVTGRGGGLVDYHKYIRERHLNKQTRLQCLPLYSVLSALRELGHHVVDLFSLDVEGAEVEILKTLPMAKIEVRTFLVETTMGNDQNKTRLKREAVTALLAKTGYKPVDVPFYIDTFYSKEYELLDDTT